MLNNIWSSILAFFALALSGLTIRNTVLVRAMGTSRLISLVDHTTDTATFGVLLTVIIELSMTGNYFLYSLFISKLPYALYLRPLGIVVCMSVSFMIVMLLSAKLAPARLVKAAVEALPRAAFNCTVLGTVVLTISADLNLLQSLGFGLGASVGFVAAVGISTEAQRKLQNRDIPNAFKGMPATLLFLAALALALYALTGYLPSNG